MILLSISIITVSAENNTTRHADFSMGKEQNKTERLDLHSTTTTSVASSQISDDDQQNSDTNRSKVEKIKSTMKLLEGYDDVTAAGVINSEPDDENLSREENNDTELISPTSKLDDVSNLDIVKAQRKQRKIEREESKEKKVGTPVLIDTIVVKGSVLQGQIDQLTSEYISFKLIYGEGSIRIDYSDVESLVTEHEYHIYFDGKETLGHISAIEDHAFLKIKHGKVEELVTIAKIDRFIISENEDTSFENRMRNTFPYISGNIDLGLEFENGNNIKNKVKLAAHVERSQGVNKTILDVLYAYEDTQTIESNETILNKHELYSFLEQNYALSKNEFIFGEIGYDFDVPRGVDHRLYPAVGYGYRFIGDKKRWVQFKVGLGFVYEQFIDNPIFGIAKDDLNNQYAAGAFAIDAAYEIRDIAILNRIELGATFFYMPGVEDLRNNWLLRYSLRADIPLSKALVFKIVARQVTDDNPSPDVGNNKFTFDLYLSLRF